MINIQASERYLKIVVALVLLGLTFYASSILFDKLQTYIKDK